MEFFKSMWEILSQNWPMFLEGTGTTLLVSLLGTIIGLIIGMVVGIIRTIPASNKKASNILLSIIKGLLNAYIQIFRGTPMIVQATLFYFGLQQFFDINMSPMTAAFFVVSINTGAYLAEVVRGGINSIDKGQFEACHALGMNHFQTMVNVVLPQAFKNIIPAVGNEFIVNIKDTSVLNVISLNELFFVTKSIAGGNFLYFESYLITSLIYLALTLGVAGLLHLLERKLSGPKSYEKISQSNVFKSSN